MNNDTICNSNQWQQNNFFEEKGLGVQLRNRLTNKQVTGIKWQMFVIKWEHAGWKLDIHPENNILFRNFKTYNTSINDPAE